MEQQIYRVVFNGETTPGKHINDVRYNPAGYYRVEPERLQHFFTGQPVTIKDGAEFCTAAALYLIIDRLYLN